jgi:hypothetical protein
MHTVRPGAAESSPRQAVIYSHVPGSCDEPRLAKVPRDRQRTGVLTCVLQGWLAGSVVASQWHAPAASAR